MDAISDKADLAVTNSSVMRDQVTSLKTENKQLWEKLDELEGVQKTVELKDSWYP